MKIWALGDAVVDLLPAGDMNYQACAGGAPLNVAVGVARLAGDSAFIGRVGNDPFGRFLKRTLEEQGVGAEFMLTDETYRTSTVVVDLATSGERSFSFLVNPSADQFLTPRDLPVFGKDILHYCSLALAAENCREAVVQATSKVKAREGWVSFDLNLREQMWSDKAEMRRVIEQQCRSADILKLSDEELLWLTEEETSDWDEALELLERYPAPLKVITRGKEGGIVFCGQEKFSFPGYNVKSIDTTGAGDAFMAGLLSWIARHGLPETERLSALLSQAGACGALATTHKGALPALPTPSRLNDFIRGAGLLTLHPL